MNRPADAPGGDDRDLRAAVEAAIPEHTGLCAFINVTVKAGAVQLWGGVDTAAARDAARVAVENVAGVQSVENRISVFPPNVQSILWAE
ncbi:MAG TPA: BON domain-containing protein [Woeseiaceae bacterium]|nr:BON domain-containing protein [Woeseiaceae bacterium]